MPPSTLLDVLTFTAKTASQIEDSVFLPFVDAALPSQPFRVSIPELVAEIEARLNLSGVGGGGIINLTMPTAVFDVASTGSSTTVTFDNQLAGRVFASPAALTGQPSFRALAYSDLAAIVGTTANTLAAGNDSRIHLPNTDTGTSAVSFGIDTTNAGFRIKNSSGAAQLRNLADDAFADLTVKNLAVTGTSVSRAAVVVVTNSRTLAATDASAVLQCGSPSTIQLTIPSNVFQAGDWIEVGRFGNGEVSFVGDGSMTLEYPLSAFTAAIALRGQGVFLRFLSPTRCWITGNLTPIETEPPPPSDVTPAWLFSSLGDL